MEKKMIPGVYCIVSSDPDFSFSPLAIRPRFDAETLSWEDTGEGYACLIKEVVCKGGDDVIPDSIIAILVTGKKIVFELLTPELFEERVKKIAAGDLEFSSIDEIQQYYLNTDFTGYLI